MDACECSRLNIRTRCSLNNNRATFLGFEELICEKYAFDLIIEENSKTKLSTNDQSRLIWLTILL